MNFFMFTPIILPSPDHHADKQIVLSYYDLTTRQCSAKSQFLKLQAELYDATRSKIKTCRLMAKHDDAMQ